MKSNRKLSQNEKKTTGKRILSILLMICICIAVTACGNSKAKSSDSTDTTAGTKKADAKETETTGPETTGPETTEPETTEPEMAEGSKTLVVYFSATGNTKAIAEMIANGLSADIYEIVPEDPYTDADLDYGDDNSRSTVEMNDTSVRPAISGSVENMEQYDTIYIGYPIWWGEAPRIMDTFVESYDFSGKTVIPFCTSASSGIGSSATNLAEVAGTGDWLDGQRFGESESQDKVMEWVNGL